MPVMNPSLLLDFCNSRQLGPLVTFTRASTATRFNRRGQIEVVPSGAPRFDHDPVTLACRGLLIEEARTNLALQSIWPGAAGGNPGTAPTSWPMSNFGTAGTATTALSPSIYGAADGAQAITFTAVTAGERLASTQAATLAVGTYVFWCYVEAVSGSPATVLAVSAITATISTAGTNALNPVGGPGQVAVVVVTCTVAGTVWLRTGVGALTGSGVTAGASVTLSRPQLELGAVPTSFIPTAGSQATRAADVVSIAATEFASFWRADRGTLMSRHRRAAIAPSGGQVSVSIRGASSSFTMSHGYGIANPSQLRADTSDGGVTQASLTLTSAAPILLPQTVVSAYSPNDFAASLNGGACVIDTAGTVPALIYMGIGVGTSLASAWLNGWVELIAYYPDRLSNADLQALSAS